MSRQKDTANPETETSPSKGSGRPKFRTSSLAAAQAIRSPGGIVEADICVYGATSGGVAAAVQAARMGRSVVLVEAGRHLGGMTSGGLSAVDIGNPKTVGGIAREYFTRLASRYGRALPWDHKLEGVPTGGAFAVEPHAAEELFDTFIAEADALVFFEKPLEEVRKRGPRIQEIVALDGTRFRAAMFIDTTYEGDLMAGAGVGHTLMREANARYGETLNGVIFQPKFEPKVVWGVAGPNGRRADGRGLWDRDLPLDPYLVEGDPGSGLLPLMHPDPVGPPGSEAPGVQAYCYRLCLTRDAENAIPLERPDGYDPRHYELVARFIRNCVAAGDDLDLRTFSKYDPLPCGKFDFNTATFGGNLLGASWAWCEADPPGRASIGGAHEAYHRGLLHFLSTDARVPEKVRQEMRSFGLCRDEFPETGGWPHQIYVREGRRMVSDLVLTQHHCEGRDLAPGSVGLGSYGMDLHAIRRVVHDGIVWREGKVGARVPHPYPIGYAAITPRAAEADNLLVTFALSATHVAHGSTRMEPVFMILSQSAATAASLAIAQGSGVQEVAYGRLAERLRADGQILDRPIDA